MAEKQVKVSIGCSGCLVMILVGTLLWAFLFGLNMNGEHHEIGCGTDGVSLEREPQ